MKRGALLVASLSLIFLSLPALTSSAQASTTILITEPTHRQIAGEFIDDELASSLGVTGRLGELVFNPPQGARTWIVDPGLVEEVTSMAKGYTLTSGVTGTGQEIAKSWLNQLDRVIKSDRVIALAIGNPSKYWVAQLSPHEINYVLDISQKRLAAILGVAVEPNAIYESNSHFTLSATDIATIKSDSEYFAHTASYVDPATIDTYRLALIKILNPNLSVDRRGYLIRDYTRAAFNQIHLVHLSPGKFTVTSSHQNLPITLTNGFPNSVKINLYAIPTNPKVEVGSLSQVVIPAKSKIQVMVPITVLTSGTSGLNVEMTSMEGNLLGDSVIYPLQLSVISPIATWFTTGAAIVLFVAASFQSIRRIRRRRK
jgi:hypothetical protein